jgi:hypothetical protein
MINNYKLTIVKVFFILFQTGIFTPTITAQEFWLTTFSFPGGPKTCITLAGDSCLVVGLTNSVMRSCDDGITWNSTLITNAIYCLSLANSGRIIAGGNGKVFYSDDLGESWDSIALNTVYPVTNIIRDVNGKLFAITAFIISAGQNTGDGVFLSEDNGMQWTQRNNGLGSNIYCDQITSDVNGRLYLAVPDPFLTGLKGLFISDDSGLSWQHINILVDGQNIFSDQITINYTTGLSVSPDDSVYISIFGTAVNVGVSLNIHKSIDDILDDNFWSVTKVANVNHWWNDRLLNNIHFANNGDWYSSVSGSVLTGGTFFSNNEGRSWDQHREGLGLDKFGSFSVQYFAENDSGKVYMVQLFDERIYWADTSMTLGLDDTPVNSDIDITIFPNPVKSHGNLEIKWPGYKGNKHLTISDLSGKVILERNLEKSTIFQAPDMKGLWLVNVRDNNYSKTFKVVVY